MSQRLRTTLHNIKNADQQKCSLRRSWMAKGWPGLACVIISSEDSQ